MTDTTSNGKLIDMTNIVDLIDVQSFIAARTSAILER